MRRPVESMNATPARSTTTCDPVVPATRRSSVRRTVSMTSSPSNATVSTAFSSTGIGGGYWTGLQRSTGPHPNGDSGRESIAECHASAAGEQAEDDRCGDVPDGREEAVGPAERDRLGGEGGEGRERTDEPDRDRG